MAWHALSPVRWLRPAAAAGALAAALAGGGSAGNLAAAEVSSTIPFYMPLISRQVPAPVGFTNESFEDRRWYTDYTHAGNQWPYGWTFHSTEQGETMPFPTKHQDGNIIPAMAGGWGEYVHKLAEQLPFDEQRGQPRGLIIDQWTVYKAFSAAIPQALVLSQVLTGTPGATMEVTGYILGETFDVPWYPHTKLEDDHWVASVQLGAAADTRYYVDMTQRYEVPGNERHWNRFVVAAGVPASGEVLLKIIVQQNWAGRTDFFIDAFHAVQHY
ncbi:MAG: hypothetical protein IT317_04575 [Anaerolineales bacterium]|nr:hypothetical protein [Anaerolineales bacterium]